MGPLYGFILFAILIGGQVLVQEVHGDELPTNVAVIHTERQTFEMTPAFEEYLRWHPRKDRSMPAAIFWEVTCYSDGSARVHPIDGFTQAKRSLSTTGYDLLRGTVLDIAYNTCTYIWEDMYENFIDGESRETWYL